MGKNDELIMASDGLLDRGPWKTTEGTFAPQPSTSDRFPMLGMWQGHGARVGH